jgi:hypothetical protein
MRLRLFLFVFCLTLAGSLLSPAQAGNIGIHAPRLVAAEEGGYALSADFQIDFNPRLEEAVTRGMTLYFVAEFELKRHRWYWMDEKVASKKQTWRLSYHVLTRQYRLSTGALHQSFATLEEALRMLSRVHLWQVISAPLNSGDEYEAALRFSLDISQLPKPFQVSALTNREWNLDSDWIYWKFTPAARAAPSIPLSSAPSPQPADMSADLPEMVPAPPTQEAK